MRIPPVRSHAYVHMQEFTSTCNDASLLRCESVNDSLQLHSPAISERESGQDLVLHHDGEYNHVIASYSNIAISVYSN